MGKKEFRSGIDRLFGDETPQPVKTEKAPEPITAEPAKAPEEKRGRGRPRTNFRKVERSSQEGCLAEETRATFIVREATLEKIKALAYWERLTLKDVVQSALAGHIERFEAERGAIKPIPGGE